MRAADIIAVLKRVRSERGGPQTLRCDNGSEFTSQLVDLWAYEPKVTSVIDPTANVDP